eukprot:1159391-Amorphochlora_amoeboformis.AAC.2
MEAFLAFTFTRLVEKCAMVLLAGRSFGLADGFGRISASGRHWTQATVKRAPKATRSIKSEAMIFKTFQSPTSVRPGRTSGSASLHETKRQSTLQSRALSRDPPRL